MLRVLNGILKSLRKKNCLNELVLPKVGIGKCMISNWFIKGSRCGQSVEVIDVHLSEDFWVVAIGKFCDKIGR